jgi:hypothetical protein
MTDDDLSWRNLITQWHLDAGMPDCGCDDDTPDHRFCPPSVAWADARYAERDDPALAGPTDPWDHDGWRAAWGYNATLIVDDRDARLPTPPEGMAWLVSRALVGGRCVMELVLYRLAEDRLTPVDRARVPAEPSTLTARARSILERLTA